jgi:hypothetical protein
MGDSIIIFLGFLMLLGIFFVRNVKFIRHGRWRRASPPVFGGKRFANSNKASYHELSSTILFTSDDGLETEAQK